METKGANEMVELKDTVDAMLADSYEERFIAEYNQLAIRLEKLGRILDDAENGQLTFEPKSPICLLEAQFKAMYRYMQLLQERAEHEGIDLGVKYQVAGF